MQSLRNASLHCSESFHVMYEHLQVFHTKNAASATSFVQSVIVLCGIVAEVLNDRCKHSVQLS